MKAYIQLGKLGDIISILPILHQEYKESGEKPHLIISPKYSMAVNGLDYIEPVIYPGEWNDVTGALREAKLRYKEVFLPQMHAKDYVPRRRYPSFQLDQWQRCGRLHQWGLLPLVIPRSEGVIPGRKILLADQSESSPFPHIEDLYQMLFKEFPPHQIVRLSSVRLPLLSDLLALYDGADLIVSIDTMHAHLSLATKTPVIILATDKPSRWHGTAYHPRMAAHIRYGDYEMKKGQLLHAAKQCVNKSSMPVVTRHQTAHKHAYNMSMLRAGNNLWKTYRYHPQKSWRTELVLIRDGFEIPIRPPEHYSQHSIEDGRLFMFNGRPHISVTVARSKVRGQTFDPCIQAYGELKENGEIVNWVEPRVGKNDWHSTEKNWAFFEHDGKLHLVYSMQEAHVVYELNKDKIVKEYRSAVPACSFGTPRGGSQFVDYKGQWLKFFHTNQRNPKSDASHNYHVGAMLVEPSPPFRITKISSQPILSGNELFSDAPHWKPKCALPYGALRNGDGFEVSLGLNDCECAIGYFLGEHLNL